MSNRRPSTHAPTIIVDKLIGTAYDDVKLVADNIEDVQNVAEIADIIDDIGGISDELIIIAENVDEVVAVGENIDDVITAADNIELIQEAPINAQRALDAAEAAEASEVAAKASEEAAAESEANAGESETNAAISEGNAAASEANARASELDAESAQIIATAQADRAQALADSLDDGIRNEKVFNPSTGAYPLPTRMRNPTVWFAADSGTVGGTVWAEGEQLHYVPDTSNPDTVLGAYYRVGGELATPGEPQPIEFADDIVLLDTKALEFAVSNTNYNGITQTGTQLTVGDLRTALNLVGSGITLNGDDVTTVATAVTKDSDTGAANIPVGADVDRPVTPAKGMLRYNEECETFEGYRNDGWASIGGGVSRFIYKSASFTAACMRAYAVDMSNNQTKTVTIPDGLEDGDWIGVMMVGYTNQEGAYLNVQTISDEWNPVGTVIDSTTRRIRISQNATCYFQKINGKWSPVDGIGEGGITLSVAEDIQALDERLTNVETFSPHSNLLINGGMSVWQRGTTQDFTGTTFFADRWQTETLNTGVSASRQQSTTDVSYYTTLAHTGATVSTSNIFQEVECRGAMLRNLQNQPISISYVANTSHFADMQYHVELVWKRVSNDADASTVIVSDPIVGTDGDQWLAFQLTVPTVLSITSGAEYKLSIKMVYSTISGAPLPDGNYHLSSAKANLGTVATPFQEERPEEVIRECRRYYWQNDDLGFRGGNINIPYTMRDVPTISATFEGGEGYTLSHATADGCVLTPDSVVAVQQFIADAEL